VTTDNSRADRLLTIKQVSELTGLAVGSLYHLVSQKRVEVVRISSRCIRFRLSSLERWFDDLTEEARRNTGEDPRPKSGKGKAC
jgi:predicted DNA-binding transcriptional regulator AlpA